MPPSAHLGELVKWQPPTRFWEFQAIESALVVGIAIALLLSPDLSVHSPALLLNVRQAFVHGMDEALVVSALIAAVAVLLALAFMPGRAPARHAALAAEREVGSVA